MSSRKQQKAELIAIYRLEFYKKQKNWKFSSEHKDKKPPEKSIDKTNLNITYNVDQPEIKEWSDPLNVAFVDSDSDPTTNLKSSKLNTIKKKELSQEWQESVNIWPQTESWEDPTYTNKKSLWTIKHRYNLADENSKTNTQKCSDKLTVHTETLVDYKPKTQKRLDDLQKAAKSFQFDTQTESQDLKGIYDENDARNEFYWPVEGVLSAGFIAQDIWTKASEDVTDGLEYANVRSTESLYQLGYLGDVFWTPEDESSVWSVDSVGEFMRGADAAPHSSEIDLTLPACVNALDVSFTSLSRLSSSQLVLAARLHSRVLRRLLLESEQRQKLRNASSLYSFTSFEEYPTRDPGPSCPINDDNNPNKTSTFFKDVFVTGSHRNGFEGRGRGGGRSMEMPFRR